MALDSIKMMKQLAIVLIFSCVFMRGESEGQMLTGDRYKRRVDNSNLPDSCRHEFQKLANHTMCLLDNPDVINSGVSQKTRQYIINEHNRIRGEVMPPATDLTYMVWDAKLAGVADKWARQCVEAHDINRDIPNYGSTIGQNTAWGLKDWSGAIDIWEQEVNWFKFGEKPESYLPAGKTWEDIGHYTQIVYNTSVRLGCGFAKCRDSQNGLSKKYYVCNYAAGQGFRQDFPYTNGTRCGACPDSCAKGICVCGGRICGNGGTLDLNTCHCKCPLLFGGIDCKTVVCPDKDAWHCGSTWSRKMCRQFITVRHQCPYMCGICPASNGTTMDNGTDLNPSLEDRHVVQEILSDYGCKITSPRLKPDECSKLGNQGRDKKDCKSRGGSVSCRDCIKSKRSREDCPVMCGICDDTVRLKTSQSSVTGNLSTTTNAPSSESSQNKITTTRNTIVPSSRTTKETPRSTSAAISSTTVPLPASCLDEFHDLRGHTMCLFDHPRVIESGVSEDDQRLIVALHNRIRGSVEPPAMDLPEIIWDDSLAEVASKWSRQCTLGHDKIRTIPSYGLSIGQNAARGSLNWTGVIDVWYREVRKYRFGEDPSEYLPEGFLEIGHYTQLVYNTTVRVGCGFSKCFTQNNQVDSFFVCNYGPGHGLRHDFPYMNGTRCGACPDSCEDGLCKCAGKLCRNHGTLNVTWCECDCQSLYHGEECEILNCPESDAWFCGTSIQRSSCSVYANTPSVCPYMCGLCKGNQTSSETSTERGSSEPTVDGGTNSIPPEHTTEMSSTTLEHTVETVTKTALPEYTSTEESMSNSTQTSTLGSLSTMGSSTGIKSITQESTSPSTARATSSEVIPPTPEPTYPTTTPSYLAPSTLPPPSTASEITPTSTSDMSTDTLPLPTTSATTHVSNTTEALPTTTPVSEKVSISMTSSTLTTQQDTTQLPQTASTTSSSTSTSTQTVSPRLYTVTAKPQLICDHSKKKLPEDQCLGLGNYGQDRRDCLSMGGIWGCPQCQADPAFAKSFCPVMCGLCEPVCGGLRCLNGGTLNVQQCQCLCAKYFNGDQCQIVKCPKHDPWYCGINPPVDFCDIEPYSTTTKQECPYMCGIC